MTSNPTITIPRALHCVFKKKFTEVIKYGGYKIIIIILNLSSVIPANEHNINKILSIHIKTV